MRVLPPSMLVCRKGLGTALSGGSVLDMLLQHLLGAEQGRGAAGPPLPIDIKILSGQVLHVGQQQVHHSNALCCTLIISYALHAVILASAYRPTLFTVLHTQCHIHYRNHCHDHHTTHSTVCLLISPLPSFSLHPHPPCCLTDTPQQVSGLVMHGQRAACGQGTAVMLL